MAEIHRLKYNRLSAALGAALADGAGTAITFASALTAAGTAVATLGADEYIPLVIDNEVVYLTAYITGATTGTISRGKEGTTGAAHANGSTLRHGPTVLDFQDGWTALPLGGSYVSHADTFGYAPAYRRIGDRVFLRGPIRPSAGNFTANLQVTVATLPAGYRPAQTSLSAIAIQGNATASAGRCDVDGAGLVKVLPPTSVAWVSLDGVSFPLR